jgi:hypothetical protein
MELSAAGSFRAFFKRAMGGEQEPYPYQERLATEPIDSRLIHVPTGAGKTAVILACMREPGRFAGSAIRNLEFAMFNRLAFASRGDP